MTAPTLAEIQAVAGPGVEDRLVYYNGTDTNDGSATYAWWVDGAGNWTLIEKPGGAGTPMVGATPVTAGSGGTVPAPNTGEHKEFLAGDGTWRDIAHGHYAFVTSGTSQSINLGGYNNYPGKIIGAAFLNTASTQHSIGQAGLSLPN